MKRTKQNVTNLLSVPSPEADDRLVNLADWVEMKALLAADGNASQEDLTRALVQAYSIDTASAKALAGDVFKELLDRHDSCTPLLGNSLLSLRGGIGEPSNKGVLYIFLLVASRADMDAQRKLNGLDPVVLFERLCADILLNFWGGSNAHTGALVFGTARTKKESGKKFEENINNLCLRLREGRGLKDKAKIPGGGDGKLDVVVWRVFSDGRSGGLVGFGQCKTGIHWKTHLTKLVPRNFCRDYFKEPLILDPIRIYMVPHRVDGAAWDSHTGSGGLLLDRCRLVQYGYDISNDVFVNCRTWLDAALHRQREGKFTV